MYSRANDSERVGDALFLAGASFAFTFSKEGKNATRQSITFTLRIVGPNSIKELYETGYNIGESRKSVALQRCLFQAGRLIRMDINYARIGFAHKTISS